MTNRRVFVGSIIVAVIGWGVLIYFTYAVWPDFLSIGVALFLFFVALLGTLAPVACYLNFRLVGPEKYQEHLSRPLRQAGFASLYVTICILLRILGILSWTTALLLLSVFITTEIALITWLR